MSGSVVVAPASISASTAGGISSHAPSGAPTYMRHFDFAARSAGAPSTRNRPEASDCFPKVGASVNGPGRGWQVLGPSSRYKGPTDTPGMPAPFSSTKRPTTEAAGHMAISIGVSFPSSGIAAIIPFVAYPAAQTPTVNRSLRMP